MNKIITLFTLLFVLVVSLKGQNIKKLTGHSYPLNSINFDNNNNIIVAGGNVGANKGEVTIWKPVSMNQWKKYGTWYTNEAMIDADISNGNVIGVGAGEKITVWDMAYRSKLEEKYLGTPLTFLTLLPNTLQDNTFLVGGMDKRIRIAEYASRRFNRLHIWRLGRPNDGKYYILDACYSQDGKYLLTSGGNFQANIGEFILWNVSTQEAVFRKDNTQVINSADIYQNKIATASEDGWVRLWDLQGNQLAIITKLEKGVSKVRFSPDGNFLAIACKDNTVRVFNILNEAKEIATYQEHNQAVMDVAFSPDGKYLASASMDKSIIVRKTTQDSHVYYAFIKEYVQTKMNEWQQKGKFEKTEDYQARMTSSNTDKQIEIFTQEAVNQLALQYFSLDLRNNEYDADNESFKLNFEDDLLAPIYLKVPIAQAKGFDENFSQTEVIEPLFTLTDQGNFVLLKAKIVWYDELFRKKLYTYSNDNLVAFNPQSLNIDPININPTIKPKPDPTSPSISNAVEITQNLPKTLNQRPNAIAVVIGNRNYKNTKNVDFATADAKLMKKYLIEVLGFKEGNILYVEDASLTDLKLVFGDKNKHKGKLFNMVKPDKSEVFVFYSGHGAPGLNDKQGYLVPVECDPNYVELTGFPINVLYDNLAKIPATSTTIILDACFSGTNIYENISPIVIKSKGVLGVKKGVLLASSQADEVSCWYNDKGQGMFTYFFLKSIHNKNADFNKDNQLTFEEIYQYIADKAEGIPYYARRIHGIEQNPVLQGEETQRVWVEFE